MIREEITKLIIDSIREAVSFKFDLKDVKIEQPESAAHGDYSTNVAFKLAGILKQTPLIVAENLKPRLLLAGAGLIEKVEIAEPGFLNFFLSKERLEREVKDILKEKTSYGQLPDQGKKIQIEFVSANPTGPLTVGNARGGPLGDVLGNVFKKAGYKTEKAYYINDHGMQISDLGHSVLKDEGAKYQGVYIDDLNKRNKEKEAFKAGQWAAKVVLKESIQKTLANLGIKYDEWFSETKLHKSKAVDKVLDILRKKELIYEKEGAQWFKSSNFGDERDRVVVKSDGHKTYLAGDLAYHYYKFNQKKFDKAINIWGADHYGDVPGLRAGVEALGFKDQLDFILLQFVTLLENGQATKMSKREGNYVAMDELLAAVGRDATRFFFLQKSPDSHLNFDLALAKEQSEKNPVFYVQYAYARICSILKKAEKFKISTDKINLLTHPSELKLIKELVRFPEIIEAIPKDYQVQRLPQYAMDLSASFHTFYANCKVLSENSSLTQARLALVSATRIILKNTLDLMGIGAPEKM
jgi:arginyl-tRNA synthetase